MANFLLCLIIQRVLLPLILIGCIVVRPVGISVLIAAFVFILPYVPVAQQNTLKGSTGSFFRWLIAFIGLVNLGHALFQVCYLLKPNPIEDFSFTLRHIGFVLLIDLEPAQIIHWILPDVTALFSTIFTFFILKKFSKGRKLEEDQLKSVTTQERSKAENRKGLTLEKFEQLKLLGILASLTALCVVGSLRPSLVNAVYFLTFVVTSTWLGCNRELSKKFANILQIISVVLSLHSISFVLYQMPWFQQVFDESSLAVRISGLSIIFRSSAKYPFDFNSELNFDIYLHPLTLFTSFLVIASTSNFILIAFNRRPDSRTINKEARGKKKFVDVVESVKRTLKSEGSLSWDISSFFFQKFYIVSNLSMMIWSIVYHSGLGFILLIWANAVWIKKDKRRIMMKSSLVLVPYAILLLVAHYVINLELTEAELPTSVSNVTLTQIGFVKYENYSGVHLIFKSILTASFWCTMRLMLQERAVLMQDQTVTVEMVTQKLTKKLNEKTWKNIRIKLEAVCVRVWMWVIIFTLFAMGAFGETMSVFRIVNITFVLAFALLIQFSLKLWIKLLNTFWKILIHYAMGSLILIYAYQFNGFPAFPGLVKLGLQKFTTQKLFLKLFSFTLVIFLTGIQMNHFNRKFVQWISNVARTGTEENVERSQEENNEATHKRIKLKEKANRALKALQDIIEVHFIKWLFFFSFWMFVAQLQILNGIFLIFLTVGAFVSSEAFKLLIARLVSIFSMAFIIGVMFFELVDVHLMIRQQFDPCYLILGSRFNIDLRSIHDWFNLKAHESTFENIKLSVVYVTVITIFFMMKASQQAKRRVTGKPIETPRVVFDEVSRLNADSSASNLTKFLINYGFYKFGIELILCVFAVSVATSSCAIQTIIHFFLFVLLLTWKRERAKLVWKLATVLLFVLILAQCLILVFFVVIRPCDDASEDLQKQTSSFLYQTLRNFHENPERLVVDFLLLLLMAMQLQVFKAEKARDHSKPFEGGGSNRSVLLEQGLLIEGLKIHEHPVYQFNDLAKHYIFKIHFWVTLVVIFLVGTYALDVLSLLYIGGAFVFLWFGTDFYLRPLPSLIRCWNILLIFNVSIIATKMLIKIFCCFIGNAIIQDNFWLTKRFGLSCDNVTQITDAIAFIFIIIQRRIFQSHYFVNVIDETNTTSVLASRGANIVETLRVEEFKRQRNEEELYLASLKLKVDTIKHSASAILRGQKEEKSYHDAAIRRGDYYMFDDESEGNQDDAEESVVSTIRSKAPSVITSKDVDEKNVEPEKTSFMETLRSFYRRCLSKLIIPMREASKNYRYIYNQLMAERKTLKLTISSTIYPSNTTKGITNVKRTQRLSKLKHIDAKLQQIKLIEAQDNEQTEITFIALLKEVFIFLLTKTGVLAYIIVCFAQISTSSIFTLPLSMFVYLWGTLTVPRPSKTFWILLIAYTQILLVFRSLIIFLWQMERSSLFIQLFEFHQNNSMAIYELLLIVVVFLHRAVLKRLGLWQSKESLITDDGIFIIKTCDDDTANLIETYKRDEKEKPNQGVSRFHSLEELIHHDEEPEDEVIVKHEISKNNLGVQAVYEDRNKLLKAYEKIECDEQGQFLINLQQGKTKLSLRAMTAPDFSKSYASSRFVVVENDFDGSLPSTTWLSFQKYFYITRSFHRLIKTKSYFKFVDVYKLMFFCDFINLFVLLIGFREFAVNPTPDDPRTIINYLLESRIPMSLLSVLVMQFAMIMIDRVLYLRKNMTCKVIFHLLIVIITHAWMFFFLPLYTGKSLNETYYPQLYYFINCVYLMISAYQIRCGYPPKVLGNFLMKKFGLINMLLFKGFMLIPFLFELRTVIDWMSTETSLIFSEWLRVEAIYAQVFCIKCLRQWMAKDFLRGTKRPFLRKKLLIGGLWSSILIGVIFTPLILYAFLPTLGTSNLPRKVDVSLKLGTYKPLYQVEVAKQHIHRFSQVDWNQMNALFQRHASSNALLDEFTVEDVVAVTLSVTSSSYWRLPAPNLERMVEDIRSGTLTHCELTMKITRTNIGSFGAVTLDTTTKLRITNEMRENLLEVLSNESPQKIELLDIFPKILAVRNSGKLSTVRELNWNNANNDKTFRNLTMSFEGADNSRYWVMKEDCNDTLFASLPHQDCENFITVFIFNDKAFPITLGDFAVQGILGIYVSLILLCSRILRSTVFNVGTSSIVVEELPNVDKIINLCNDIYTVREAKEFVLEENLVAKLLFLYRSPETLIKWTKLKE